MTHCRAGSLNAAVGATHTPGLGSRFHQISGKTKQNLKAAAKQGTLGWEAICVRRKNQHFRLYFYHSHFSYVSLCSFGLVLCFVFFNTEK